MALKKSRRYGRAGVSPDGKDATVGFPRVRRGNRGRLGPPLHTAAAAAASGLPRRRRRAPNRENATKRRPPLAVYDGRHTAVPCLWTPPLAARPGDVLAVAAPRRGPGHGAPYACKLAV